MSQLHVEVTTIDEVKPHPNADRLALAVVGGWQCVVAKDTWEAGDKAVFFPPDTILSTEVSDRFGVTQYLSKGRIKHTRLRGEPSFGLVVKPDEDWTVGTDVASHYGATKYEPPVREQQTGNRSGGAQDHPKFSRYTDIDNLRHYRGAFVEGETVVITEKIHGANVRIGIIDGELVAGSRRLQRERPTSTDGDTYLGSTYWWPVMVYPGIGRMLESYVEPRTWWQRLLRRPKRSATVIVYGEVFGPSVQSFDYGLKGGSLDFRAFDIMIDGQFLSYAQFKDACEWFGIPTAPELYVGPYRPSIPPYFADGPSEVGGTHIREGVVVRPIYERRDPRIGRVVLKYVSDAYLLKDKKSDYTDV